MSDVWVAVCQRFVKRIYDDAMTSFQPEKCCRLVSKHKASAGASAAAAASS